MSDSRLGSFDCRLQVVNGERESLDGVDEVRVRVALEVMEDEELKTPLERA